MVESTGRVGSVPWLGFMGRTSSSALLKLPMAGRKRAASFFNPVPAQGWEWASLGSLSILSLPSVLVASLSGFSLCLFLQGSVRGSLSVLSFSRFSGFYHSWKLPPSFAFPSVSFPSLGWTKVEDRVVYPWRLDCSRFHRSSL